MLGQPQLLDSWCMVTTGSLLCYTLRLEREKLKGRDGIACRLSEDGFISVQFDFVEIFFKNNRP
jgi:hypothetical protein